MKSDLLIHALRQKMGETLTPEVAAWILAVAEYEPDRTIDYRQFEALACGRYTIYVSSFKNVLPELRPLHEAHWQETERHRHGIALKPDEGDVLRREREGRVVQFVIRDMEDEVTPIVGHLRMYLHTSVHTSTLYAEEDTLYVHPAHRGGQLGLKLLRYAEECLKKLGVREIRANSKLVNNADVLMRRMRYKPVATQFVKIIEESPDVQ